MKKETAMVLVILILCFSAAGCSPGADGLETAPGNTGDADISGIAADMDETPQTEQPPQSQEPAEDMEETPEPGESDNPAEKTEILDDPREIVKNAYLKLKEANSLVYRIIGDTQMLVDQFDISDRLDMTISVNKKENEWSTDGFRKLGTMFYNHTACIIDGYKYIAKNKDSDYFVIKEDEEQNYLLFSEYDMHSFIDPDLFNFDPMVADYREETDDYRLFGAGPQDEVFKQLYQNDKHYLFTCTGASLDGLQTTMIIDRDFNLKRLKIKGGTGIFVDIEVTFEHIGDYREIEFHQGMLDTVYDESAESFDRELNLLLSQENYSDSIALCEQHIEGNRQNRRAYILLGYLYAGNEEFDKARELFHILASENPLDAEILSIYSYSLFKTGNTDEAVKYADQALALALTVEYPYEVLAETAYADGEYITAALYGSVARMFGVVSYRTGIIAVKSYIAAEDYVSAFSELLVITGLYGETDETKELMNKLEAEKLD